MAGQNLAPLVFLDLSHFCGIGGRVVLNGDRRRHPAHGESTALVADIDKTLHVGLHERSGHGKMAAIGGDLVVVRLEFLDVAEEVVPATAVEAKRVVLELVEDLLHLKGRRDGLEQDSRSDGPQRDTEVVLGGDKDVVPKAGLQVSLQLGDVEVRAGPLADEVVDVVVEVQAEVEEGTGRHLAVDGDVRLVQMPAAGPDEEDGRVPVLLGGVDLAVLGVGVGDGAPDGVAEVALPLGQVAPRRRGGVLEVGHVHVGSGVEAVDDHLAVDGSRNLDAAVLKVGGDRRALPRRRVVVRLRLPAAVGEATVVRDEVRLAAGIELHGPRRAGGQ
mmetsp:Transcript_13779/g.32783  ORF Transcript_13779/g.32783 Transcript_13779/m.32783 type:complete len:330 (+) Transcript_13779:681-1670(+)